MHFAFRGMNFRENGRSSDMASLGRGERASEFRLTLLRSPGVNDTHRTREGERCLDILFCIPYM